MSSDPSAWKFYAGTVGAVMVAVGMIATAAWAIGAAADGRAGKVASARTPPGSVVASQHAAEASGDSQ